MKRMFLVVVEWPECHFEDFVALLDSDFEAERCARQESNMFKHVAAVFRVYAVKVGARKTGRASLKQLVSCFEYGNRVEGAADRLMRKRRAQAENAARLDREARRELIRVLSGGE